MKATAKKAILNKINVSRVNLNTAWDHIDDGKENNGVHFLLETIILLQESVSLLQANGAK